MLVDEQNYETHDADLLAMVKLFWTWRYYLKRAAYTILVFADNNNLKKFRETTRLNGRNIWWEQKLSRYDFKIKYQ